MATSQNGWPIVDSSKITNAPILGHTFPNGFLKGDVYEAFVWLFTQLNNRVEDIDDGMPLDDWGWYVKNIEGTTTKSNHGSGTAGDYNARLHPMGERNTYSTAKRAEIHQILEEAHGIFRWGGDYHDRPDDMHFEIVASPAAVHAFVSSVKAQERYKMTIPLNGFALPTLMTGDDDSKMAGPDYVHRAQFMLNYAVNAGLKVDGVYGPATVNAVKKLQSNANGKSVGINEWTQLYGLSKAAVK